MSPSYRRLCANLECMKEGRSSVPLDAWDRFHFAALMECAGVMAPVRFKRAIETAVTLIAEQDAGRRDVAGKLPIDR